MRHLYLLLLTYVFLSINPFARAAPNISAYRENVVDYSVSWPEINQVSHDLPRMQQLLEASALRIQVSGASLPSLSNVLAMQEFLRNKRLNLEILITQANSHQEQYLNWLSKLKQQDQPLPLIIIDSHEDNIDVLYEKAQSIYPSAHLGVMSSDKQKLKDLAQRLSPSPRLFLYAFRAPLHDLHQDIYDLNPVMKHTNWQITRFGSPEDLDEYHQAWLYRLVFYFSKKYGLAPASVLFQDRQAEGFYFPGITRENHEPHTSFWLSQIYFHVKRIDLDEHKLTAALYEYVPDNYPVRKFKSAQEMAQYFLLAHYKVTPQVNPLAYIKSKKSAVFYDFLQQRSEESLLNSHFSKLENLKLLKHKKEADQELFTFAGEFVSSIGTFGFAQDIAVQKEDDSFRVSQLGRPQLNSPIKTYTKQSQPLQIIHNTHEMINTSYYTDQQGDSWLAYQTRQNTDKAVMLQPLYLQEDQTGQVMIPHRLDFLFYKNLTTKSGTSGLINLERSTDKVQFFNAKTYPAPHIQPREFITEVEILNDHIQLSIINPLVERILLPAVRFGLSSAQHKFTFQSVLPQALLPLEHRIYQLPLPEAINQSTDKPKLDYSEGQGFPILNLEINQDDAFRSKTLERPRQALIKYREVLKRFGKQLSSERRFRLIREIALLAAVLEPEQILDEIDQNLLLWLTNQSLDSLFYDYLGEILFQNKHLPQAIQATQRSLSIAPKELKTWLFLAHIHDSQGDWSNKIRVLNQALEELPGETKILEQLVNIYEHTGRYAASADILKLWLEQAPSAQGYARLAYLSEQAYRWQDAVFAYKKQLHLSPQAKIYLNLGKVYQHLGQTGLAIKAYQSYLKICPRCSVAVYADLAYLFKKIGNKQQAIIYYRKHLAATGAHSSRLILAELEQAQGFNTQAIATLLPLVQNCRNTCSAQAKKLAYLYQQQKNWTQALKYYKQAFKGSNKPDDLSLMAYLSMQSNQKPEAIAYFQQALSQSLNNSDKQHQWQLSLAALYRQTGQAKLAIPLLKESLSHAQQEHQIANLLAAYLEAGQAEAAKTFLQSQAHWDLKQAESHYLLGKVYQATAQWEQALAPLQTAICKSVKPQVEYYRLLAESYKQLGDIQRSIQWLEELDHYLSSGSTSGGPSESLCRL